MKWNKNNTSSEYQEWFYVLGGPISLLVRDFVSKNILEALTLNKNLQELKY